MKEGIEKLNIEREKELKQAREDLRVWKEAEIKEALERKDKGHVGRLRVLKEKDLSELELRMFQIFQRFILVKEAEEDFDWKEFLDLEQSARKQITEDPNNSKLISINLFSDKLAPLIEKRRQEEENRE